MLYTLEQSVVNLLPSNGKHLDKGNPDHATYIKVTEDCEQMITISAGPEEHNSDK